MGIPDNFRTAGPPLGSVQILQATQFIYWVCIDPHLVANPGDASNKPMTLSDTEFNQ